MNYSLSPLVTARQVVAPVVNIEELVPHHFLVSLWAPDIARQAQAGQFLHILPREAVACDPFLRRAFSIMATREDEVDLLLRVQGSGTAHIASRRIGDFLDILGPLGCPFDLRLFHVKQKEPLLTPILVGGGVGVPPLVFLAETFLRAHLYPTMLIGARKADELVGLRQLEKMGVEVRLATDDGSMGHLGRVTDLLDAVLKSNSRAVIYSCGPLPMLRVVAEVAARFEVPCQVSLEENMPCGIGVCNGCVVAMKQKEMTTEAPARNDLVLTEVGSGQSDYGRFQRICVTGPALWADKIDWETI